MSSQQAPRNRKERRAAAKEGRTADSIPMTQPDRTRPKGKTLFQLAAEREAALRGRSTPAFAGASGDRDEGEPAVVTINPDGTLSGPDGEPLSDDISAKIKASMGSNGKSSSGSSADDDDAERTDRDAAPIAEAILYTITLCVLHFTFSVLVTHQYGMSDQLSYSALAWKTTSLLPLLAIIVFMLHPKADTVWAQALFLAMSVGSGCWLVHATSNYPYMAMMKNAPGAGTIWVWSALESRAEVAAVGAAIVGCFFWYGGHSIYS